NEVKLQLTLRSYSENVRAHTIAAIKRICRGEAIAAGVPDDLLPIVTVAEEQFTPATYNDPTLTRRVRGAITAWVGADNVKSIDPEMGGEDFGLFSLDRKIPLTMFRVGAVDPAKYAESQRTGEPLPSLHSSKFAPLPEPTIKTGITAMTGAALDLLAKK
ncbi:MAG TPA: M20/M25/M40 family metallo-hydrolase, partial [Lacunisphaera sp.]